MPSINRIQQLDIAAPVATIKKHTETHHGKTLSDDYHWLKDPNYPAVEDEQVLDYLRAENAYYYAFLEPHRELVDTIFEEFKGRTDESDTSVPYTDNGYEYRRYFEPEKEYIIRSRKKSDSDKEEVFLDENALAEGHEYFVLGDWDICPKNRLLAYSFDTSGDERYAIEVIDLKTGKKLSDKLTNVNGSVLFNADGSQLMYAELETERWHAKDIKIHKMGTDQSEDKVIYHEADDGFFVSFGMCSSREFVIISTNQREVAESYCLAADFSDSPKMLVSRDAGFDQSIDHAHGDFYILANDTHKNYRLAKVSVDDPHYGNWETVIAGSDDVYLIQMQPFDQFIAVHSRDRGYEKVCICDYQFNETAIDFPEEIFAVNFGNNPEFDQSHLRLSYESMITPPTVYDYQVAEKNLQTRKVQKIPSGYDKTQYETKRVMATARDGKEIPISIVYSKGYQQDGSQPLWLYGYGAYAATMTPTFSAMRLSALDRGFAFTIAHVRGGAMLGYNWYLDGKLENRTNTFNDFVDAADYLIEQNYVSKGNISISGASAGGELMGAAVIQKPGLWRSVTLGVPFVDVLNTMLDESLPLTPPEWMEWGNPITDPKAFDLIKSYSPYDNISARDYPPMLVTGGLNDPRVTYWEPAKWTAKMRKMKTDKNLLVMRMNMSAGHFSNSGRYGRLKDLAEEYAFLFVAHGINK